MPCSNDYALITDETTCTAAATTLVAANEEFSGLATTASAPSEFIEGNPYTAGCYWNNRGKNLWFNQYGIEGQCTGPKDCRTLCIKRSIYIFVNFRYVVV